MHIGGTSPGLIYPIDAIARQKKRVVLMLSFRHADDAGRPMQGLRLLSSFNWAEGLPYKELLHWLQA